MAKVVTSVFSGFVPSALPPVVDQLPPVANSSKKIITMEEVSWHHSLKDCWIIIYDRVYDVTNFLDEHPGGSELFLDYAGQEATAAFRGTGHSAEAIRTLNKFCIGELPIHERLFRKPGGIQLRDIPE